MVTNPTKSNIAFLWDNFPIAEEDLTATLPPLQRQRAASYDDYTVIIMQFPYYEKDFAEIRASELDLFIGKDFFISVTDGKLPPLTRLFDSIHDNPSLLNKQFNNSIEQLIAYILDELHQYLFPMLNHISQDLDTIEQQILNDHPIRRDAIKDILATKQNIVSFRRIMQSHRNVMMKIMDEGSPQMDSRKIETYFKPLIHHTTEVWSSLENFRDTVSALHETHESLINFRTNEIIKTLTIFSVIVFPLTLLAAIFGMNAVNMPLVANPSGFWVIIAIMLVGAGIMYFYFRHRRWI